MHCDEFNRYLDDYLDGGLEARPLQLCHMHVDSCVHCRRNVDDAQNLRASLAAYGKATTPQPETGFYDRALAKAALIGARKQRKRWVLAGFGSAIAATLMLMVVSSVFFTTDDIGQPAIPGITMALETPHTFNLIFSSADVLQDASMTVTLPLGIEIVGFAGQSEITWKTSLKQGRNILPLTLIATSPMGGELLATLQHENDNKMFRLQVSVI